MVFYMPTMPSGLPRACTPLVFVGLAYFTPERTEEGPRSSQAPIPSPFLSALFGVLERLERPPGASVDHLRFSTFGDVLVGL